MHLLFGHCADRWNVVRLLSRNVSEMCTFVVGLRSVYIRRRLRVEKSQKEHRRRRSRLSSNIRRSSTCRLHSVGRQCIEKRSRLPKKKCLAREMAARLAWLLSHVGRSRCAAREGGGEWERPSASDARSWARGVPVRDAFADAVAAPGRGSCCEGLARCKCSFPTVQTA